MDEDRRAGHGQYGSLRPIVAQAVEEAGQRGSTTVEAEDLLLALASAGTPETRAMLADAGLDHQSILDALRNERRHSLNYIGIAPLEENRLTTAPRTGRPGWGTSVREAMGRGRMPLNKNRQRGVAECDVLIGVLLARLGTVPRALALAGIDIDALIGRLQRERTH